MKAAFETNLYAELVGEPTRQELKSKFPLGHVSELFVLGSECLWLQLTNLVLLKKVSQMDLASFQQVITHNPQLKYRYFVLFSSECASVLVNDTFAIINT